MSAMTAGTQPPLWYVAAIASLATVGALGLDLLWCTASGHWWAILAASAIGLHVVMLVGWWEVANRLRGDDGRTRD